LLPPAAAHVFVADLEHPDMDEADARHLSRSLRLRPGEVVTVSDGAGGWRVCRYRGGRGGRGARAEAGALEPEGPATREPRPHPPVTVGFALSKGDRPEWTTQKLTEVGVDHIRPIVTSRTVVRWEGDRAARNHARLLRVATEAAMQARRTWLPTLAPLASLSEASRQASLVSPVALAQAGGRPPSLERPAVMVGPEGGWAPDELDWGLPTVGLGDGVLRVETAAVAAAVLLCGLRAGLVMPDKGGP